MGVPFNSTCPWVSWRRYERACGGGRSGRKMEEHNETIVGRLEKKKTNELHQNNPKSITDKYQGKVLWETRN